MEFRQKSIRSPTILESKERKKQSAPVQKILVPRSFHNPDDSCPVLPKSPIAWLEIPRDFHMFFFPTLQSAFKAREGRVVLYEPFTATPHETCRQSMRRKAIGDVLFGVVFQIYGKRVRWNSLRIQNKSA